ncbi:hypothetical protein Pfo_004232 [Paulownia fortunei]|nr:hypothetical protein Pfo_004232 [Paulownia fortunei]
MWQLSNQFNWHDKAMLFEQYHWKKAFEKKQPYKFKWNQMDKELRDSYYFNWPVYFPSSSFSSSEVSSVLNFSDK